MTQERAKLVFPQGFLWGAATSSYQIEGAAQEAGRGESIWDRFARTSGRVFEGQTGNVACDHFHRFEEDVKLMADLGLKSYRFSIAWSRLFPKRGVYNPQGIDFYKRLISALHEAGIVPAATIYHWDLPQWLQDAGGWANRETVSHFVEYADKLFSELGDQVPIWITHNEPWCAAFLGHGMGAHAPGHQDWYEAVAVAHHLLLSHGEVVKLYRSRGQSGQIGITLNLTHVYPATDSALDIAAAWRNDGMANRWFLDPLFHGRYPTDMRELAERVLGPMDFVFAGDVETMATQVDFLGVNYYSRSVVKHGETDYLFGTEHVRGGGPETDMGWEICPEGLYDLLTRIRKEYTEGPIYITENGAAFADELRDGEVLDDDRIEYLKGHLAAANRFVQEGGNLRGYYAWSLMDNFEWAYGYDKRFGLVHIDYDTLKRTPKASARWYSAVIRENAVSV